MKLGDIEQLLNAFGIPITGLKNSNNSNRNRSDSHYSYRAVYLGAKTKVSKRHVYPQSVLNRSQ